MSEALGLSIAVLYAMGLSKNDDEASNASSRLSSSFLEVVLRRPPSLLGMGPSTTRSSIHGNDPLFGPARALNPCLTAG